MSDATLNSFQDSYHIPCQYEVAARSVLLPAILSCLYTDFGLRLYIFPEREREDAITVNSGNITLDSSVNAIFPVSFPITQEEARVSGTEMRLEDQAVAGITWTHFLPYSG